MNQQFHGEFVDPFYHEIVDARFHSAMLFDASKRLLKASGANIQEQRESYELHISGPAVPRDGRKSQQRSTNVLTLDCTTRLKYPALMLVVMLGSAVFIWGLGYKLSLYHRVTAQRSTPAAKLLSQEERPALSVKTGSLFGIGKSLQDAPHKTLSHTHLARLDAAHLGVAGEPGELTGTSRPLAQRPWHITSSSPRAPPAGA